MERSARQSVQVKGVYEEEEDVGFVAAPEEHVGGAVQGGAVQVTRRANDVPFAIAFVLHIIAVGVLVVVWFVRGDFSTVDEGGDRDNSPNKDANKALGLCAASSGSALALALGWTFVIKRFAGALIHITLWGGVVVNLLVGGVLLGLGALVGLVFLFIALFGAVYAVLVRSRIPFATLVLTKSVHTVQRFPSLFTMAIACQLVLVAWIVLWGMLAIAVQQRQYKGMWVLLVLSLYWTCEVIRNVSHVVVCGTAASVYFEGPNANPHAVSSSLTRALTTSFGSICFGSLLIAIVRTLRAIVQKLRERARGGGLVLQVFVLCLSCVVSFLEWAVRFFNKYAFVQVAVYGKDFLTAAKDTWELLKSSGVDLLINDDLIEGVLVFGSFITACVNSLFWTAIAYNVFDHSDSEWIVVGVVAFLFGLTLSLTLSSPIDSAVATLFVCTAEQPDILSRTDPEFYSQLMQVLADKRQTIRASLNNAGYESYQSN